MSLQAALYAGPFFALLSFGAYLFAAIYVEEDKKNVEIAVKSETFNFTTLELKRPLNGFTKIYNIDTISYIFLLFSGSIKILFNG